MSNRAMAPNPQESRISSEGDLLKSARAFRRSENRSLGKTYYNFTDDDIRCILAAGFRFSSKRLGIYVQSN